MSLMHLIFGKTSDTTYQAPRLDVGTHVLSTIEYEHHEIHAGSSFTCDYKRDVANGANLDVILTTPDTTKWLHLTWEVDCELEADINIYEGAVTGTGTTITVYNRDRNSAVTSSTLVQLTPVAVTTGTTIIRGYHVGTGKSSGATGVRATHEFILKQNTKYLFRFTNATTSDNWVALKLDWYEHTNRTA
jgi:hypothetical protein